MAAIFSHRCLGRCRCLPASGGIFVDPSSSSRSLSMSLICAPEQASKDEIRRKLGRRSNNDSKIDEDRDEDRDDEWIPDEAHFGHVHEYAQRLIEKLSFFHFYY